MPLSRRQANASYGERRLSAISNAQELGDGIGHLHGTALVGVAPVDGGLGDFGGVVPDVLGLEHVVTGNGPAADLVTERAVGETEPAGEFALGETFSLGQA
jgi:hypothetical protein